MARIAAASRILRADGRFDEPNIECDIIATFGCRPKRWISSAASCVMAASSSAVGSSFTKVSVMNSVYFSSISAFMAANTLAPGARPITSRTCSRWASKRPTVPHSSASASPICISMVPISVFERRSATLAMSGVTPSRPRSAW
ncbi:hypothetical protein D3C81_1574840 [compost metagenome]